MWAAIAGSEGKAQVYVMDTLTPILALKSVKPISPLEIGVSRNLDPCVERLLVIWRQPRAVLAPDGGCHDVAFDYHVRISS